MLTSKKLIELTGISRATLNNYVAMGILPSPQVRNPDNPEVRATRMGYFPESALDRIRMVQQLKREGLPMAAIVQKLGGIEPRTLLPTPSASTVTLPTLQGVRTGPTPSGFRPLSGLRVELSIDDFPGPAYMVNNRFELVWWNEKAVKEVFRMDGDMPADVESRNALNLLVEAYRDFSSEDLTARLQPHLEVAKRRLSHQTLIRIFSSLSARDLALIETLYAHAAVLQQDPIIHYPVSLPVVGGGTVNWDLYVCFYREGILFTYSPVTDSNDFLINFLAQRSQVIRELLRKRKPFLSHVAVMVADLQHSTRICAELPAEEYFELINNIWQESEPIFRKYYGTYGKHAGDGMVYYFFPQPDCDYTLNAIRCALELQARMRKLSQRWQARKGWLNDILLNIGLNEGQEWFGTFHAGAHVEFAVLGETINQAARISEFARHGSIWATKRMLNQISWEERQRIRFGIPRQLGNNDTLFVNDTYASVNSLLDTQGASYNKLTDIQALAITQIRSIHAETFE